MKRKRKREEVFWVTLTPVGNASWMERSTRGRSSAEETGRRNIDKIEACRCKSSIYHSNDVNHELLIELVDDVSCLGCATSVRLGNESFLVS
jgi:hypothetical protein